MRIFLDNSCLYRGSKSTYETALFDNSQYNHNSFVLENRDWDITEDGLKVLDANKERHQGVIQCVVNQKHGVILDNVLLTVIGMLVF